MKKCAQCSIFNHQIKTCGTAGEMTQIEDEVVTSGCYCFMPVKAADPESKCWKDENNIEGGWDEGNIKQS